MSEQQTSLDFGNMINFARKEYYSPEYTEDYIKNYWKTNHSIFDVRDYESLERPEWIDHPKEISKETLTDMVHKRLLCNSGHGSLLIKVMISEHGWSEEKIVDYLLQFKEKHISSLRDQWKKEITNPAPCFKDDLDHLKEVFGHYVCCCNNLNEFPELFKVLKSRQSKVK